MTTPVNEPNKSDNKSEIWSFVNSAVNSAFIFNTLFNALLFNALLLATLFASIISLHKPINNDIPSAVNVDMLLSTLQRHNIRVNMHTINNDIV